MAHTESDMLLNNFNFNLYRYINYVSQISQTIRATYVLWHDSLPIDIDE